MWKKRPSLALRMIFSLGSYSTPVHAMSFRHSPAKREPVSYTHLTLPTSDLV